MVGAQGRWAGRANPGAGERALVRGGYATKAVG